MSPALWAQPDPSYLGHDRTRTPPPTVDPGTASTLEAPGRPPSDAVVLFDGKDLGAWVAMDGSPTRWVVKDEAMECVPGSGYVRTLQNFGDCQLHLEFAAPTQAESTGQGRGNSGVFFGRDRYEIQVLDSYGNATYADGSAGAVYGQYPPLVNASRPPGRWQTYDLIWTAPRFDAEGKTVAPARLTALHNGVLIQNHVELRGPTGWLELGSYRAHAEKQPIALQDHGNPVRFRNVWVRELGRPGRREFTYGAAVLDRHVGNYEVNKDFPVAVTREGEQLFVRFGGAQFALFAESPTRFFAKTIDVRVEFPEGAEPEAVLSVGEGAMRAKRVK